MAVVQRHPDKAGGDMERNYNMERNYMTACLRQGCSEEKAEPLNGEIRGGCEVHKFLWALPWAVFQLLHTWLPQLCH